jgi:hypothetical protein
VFGEIHDRVKPFDILWGHPTPVLGESRLPRAVVVVEPAVVVKAAIHPDNIIKTESPPGICPEERQLCMGKNQRREFKQKPTSHMWLRVVHGNAP